MAIQPKDEKLAAAKDAEQSKEKPGSSTTKKDAKPKDDKSSDDLSEEDLALKQSLELMVERVQDKEAGVQHLALESMRQEIKSATSSMTSVPKPLKFLRSHYGTLKEAYETGVHQENKTLLADVLSVLAMTMAEDGKRESLTYRLEGSAQDLGSWGHEYVRNLAGEIGAEFHDRQLSESPVDDLLGLVTQIVPFHVKHNAEPEAVDLLLEVDQLPLLAQHIDASNYSRTCLYLCACASYMPDPEDLHLLKVAYDIFAKLEKHTEAIRMALRMGDDHLVRTTFALAKGLEKKQLAYTLARQGFYVNLEEEEEVSGAGPNGGSLPLASEEEREELQEVLNNSRLTEGFLALARDLDVMEPKLPEDIYKAHLLDHRASQASSVDSARQNLAATFVNGFVNAGFGQDKLLTAVSESGSTSSSSWLFKNKEHGKISATASLGLIVMWDVDGGLPVIDKYLYSTDPNITAGALLAVGVVNSGVRNECDPAFALLSDSVEKSEPTVRIGAILGLGLAYAGTQKEEVISLLIPALTDSSSSLDVAAFAALSLGLVCCSSCNEEVAQSIILAIMERGERELGEPLARHMCVGLGLLFLGKQDAVDATVEVAKTFHPKISKFCQLTLESCAFAGSGNVLKVQEFLAECSAPPPDTSDDASPPASSSSSPSLSPIGPAVLGIAMVAMAEELGSDMAVRALEHLLQYGDAATRRAVPLALGLLSVSNPKMGVMDTLSRLSHDSDGEVAMAAIVALGLIGAGTNNARVAGILRNLSSYYYKDPSVLFCVRIAQGLTHLGKGLLTLNPYHSHKFLLSSVALAGLTSFLHSCLDIKSIVLARYHFTLFLLVPAMKPRMLLTVDEDLKPLSVSVRVGQAVDVVGQAGRPKTITGFQTYNTPVLLATGDRAELATDKHIPVTSVLEGYVILKKNPDYVEDHLGS